jgi:hypothetical protein
MTSELDGAPDLVAVGGSLEALEIALEPEPAGLAAAA